MKLELVNGWTTADYGDEMIRNTSGSLRITLGNRPSTLVLDMRSHTTREDVRVAFYPLALWFASSWWRLRWEADNSTSAPASHTISWRMAHEMSAAGNGYVWPRVAFRSDGETVDVASSATDIFQMQPIRYLLDTNEVVKASLFEEVVDSFLDLVLSRLNEVGIGQTLLHDLWYDVLDERRDLEASEYRRIEARLGFDPDEAPEQLIKAFISLGRTVGRDVASELAQASAGPDPASSLSSVERTVKSGGILARPPLLNLRQLKRKPAFRSAMPWERGYMLAETVRNFFGISDGPVSDHILADLFQMNRDALGDSAGHSKLPVGLAVREQDSTSLRLWFNRALHESRRFEAARFCADCLTAPETDRWLAVTEYKTARQKLQRAFAAELLCPVSALRDFLGDDLSDERINEAGKHFQVSPLIVEHQRDNQILNVDKTAFRAET